MSNASLGEFTGTARFVVEKRLGAGGMGVVYQAFDNERGVRVALKVLPEFAPNALVHFKREFRSLASIVHPRLIELYELVGDGHRWFFTMEVIDGVDFLSWVRPVGALDEDRLRAAMNQLVDGLSAVHRAGRVHQDIKPSNVMVRPNGDVVILDFGLVGELGSASSSAGVAGTYAYIAPEQWANAPLVAARDWYAVGIMLHEALTGRQPHIGKPSDVLRAKLAGDAPPPSTYAPDIPADLDALCRDLLLRDPSLRPGASEVLERLGFTGTFAVQLAPTHGVLVGREPHLRALNAAFEAMESGTTVTAHVQGPSGTGKSTLLQHFLEPRRRAPNTVVLSGRCYEQESVPYKALDSLIDALADHLSALSPAEVEPLVPVQAAALARVFPVLQRVPAIASAPSGALRITDPREMRRAAIAALREMLTRFGQRNHLVLVIDDLQWGDVDSATVISELLLPPDPPRMLLVLAYRSEYSTRSACLRTLLQQEVVVEPWQRRVEVMVAPLSTGDGEELARRLLATMPDIHPDDVSRIALESGGNPYFIGELSRHVGTSASREAESQSGTVDLDQVLWTRVRRLPPTARELLEVAAVAGQPVELGVLLSTASTRPDVAHALALLRAEHLLRSSGPQLTDFVETYHDRVRESVVHRLRADSLRQYHAGLAVALEATGRADAETLAGHFEGAGDRTKAGGYYRVAAAKAASTLAFDHAAIFYRQAIRAHAGNATLLAELQRELGHALSNAGRGFEAAEAFLAAVATAPESERYDLERMAAEQYCISGYVAEGRVIFQRLLKAVGLSMPANPAVVLGTLLYRRARLRVRGLSYSLRSESAVAPATLRRIDLLWSIAAGLSIPNAVGVASLLAEGLRQALDAGEPYRLSRLLSFEAFVTGSAGPRADKRASALIDLAEQIAKDIDNPHARGVALVMRSLKAHLQGKFREAIRFAEEGETILREECRGVWWEISLARTVMGWAAFYLADCADLRRRSALYLAEARDRGDRFLVTNLRTVTSPFLLLLDDEPEAAARELDDAMTSWPREGFDLQHANGMYTFANIEMYRGNGAAALASMDARWQLLVRGLQLQTQMVRVMMTDTRARAALRSAEQSENPAPLIARAEKTAKKLAAEGTPLAEGFSQSLLAGIASLRGQNDRVSFHLRETLRVTAIADDGFRNLAARVRLAHLGTGEAGRANQAAVDEIALRERIRNPDRLADMLIPGFRVQR